jgi:hypothetical protein
MNQGEQGVITEGDMKSSVRKTCLALIMTMIAGTAAANGSVVVSPSAAQVKPGSAVQFSASGGSIVVWSLTGAGCSGVSCGSISSSGYYTAPATAPNPSTVTIRATSIFDVQQVGTATVTIGAATVAVSISPASVTLGLKAQQQFSAHVTGSSNTGVNWSVSGIGCVAGSCGTISSTGLYTAPSTLPNPSVATVTATSVADPTKSAQASVVIQSASGITVSVSPTVVQVSTGKQQQFSASVTGTTNTSVRWSLSGPGCSGAACGTISTSGLYTAPAAPPSPATVNVTATSLADTSKSGLATVTLVSGSTLSITPATPQLKPQGQVQFAASGPGSGIVVWSVSGSNCSGLGCGSISSTGLYTAPATAPNPLTVKVTAMSITSPGVSGSTTATVASSSVGVTVSPESSSVGVNGHLQFKATVTGASNTAVTWTLSGFACAGTTCGTISNTGLYTAPGSLPNPPFVTVTATSVADPTKSASASLTIAQQIGITISPTTAQVVEGQTKQFSATVTGTTNTAVTWSVSGTGCSGSACGTISPSGLYTAPDTALAAVVVTATAASDNAVSAHAQVMVVAPVHVAVSPASTIVAVGTQEIFRATVTGTQNTTVGWSVSGAGCSGTACGTISTAGVYTAPATLPSPAAVTVKATAQANGTSSATAAVALVASNNSKLAGQYAFSFTGYDSTGAWLMAGSFTADGSGKITSGREDVNNVAGPATSLPITGTYQVTSDNRGTLTLRSSLGTFTYKLALNTLGKKGRFISFDDSGVRGSGILERQDPSAFDPSAFASGYVLALSGGDGFGGRVSALGLIFPDGVGFISGSTLDVNDAGAVSPTFAPFSGVYSVDQGGRGTATLILPGLGGGVLNFAFYVVSANEFLMVSTDPIMTNNLILGGLAQAQTQDQFAFSSASFKGPSIFTLTGSTGSAPDDMVGRFTFDGSVNVAAIFDENNAGNTTVAGSLTGAYDIELNGRGTLNLNTPTGSRVWYIYATGPNQGFVMDASSLSAGIGQIFSQTILPPFLNSDVVGSYVMGPDDPVVQTTPLASAVTSFDGSSSAGGKGTVSGAEDVSRTSGLSSSQVIAGTYSISGVSNNGRGAILLTSPAGQNIAVWVPNSSEFVGLDLSSGTVQPVILHFEQ